MRGKVVGIDSDGGRVRAVHVEQQGERQTLEATHLVLAAGPMQKDAARLIGVDLPIVAERHFKISLPDTLGDCPAPGADADLARRAAPALERGGACRARRGRGGRAGCCAKFPAGVHGRPDGSGTSTTLLVLFNYDNSPADVVFPAARASRTTPRSRCAACRPWCRRCRPTSRQAARPYVDGGYYIKTRENRPLIGPLPVEGAYISGAYSGFGVMASCAGGELLARHVTGSALPDYAPAFLLSRYQDPEYCALARSLGRRRPALRTNVMPAQAGTHASPLGAASIAKAS